MIIGAFPPFLQLLYRSLYVMSVGTHESHEDQGQVLHLSWGNLPYQHRLGEEQTERSPAKEELGVLVGEAEH